MVAKLLTRRSRIAQLRAATERALHPIRRRRALDALRQMPTPQRILVLCHGNVCRSPVAAAVLARELGDADIDVSSAGLARFRAAMPQQSMEAALRMGIDLEGHKSQLATHAMVAAADLVVVMEASHARVVRDYFGTPRRSLILLGDCDPAPIDRRSI